MASHRCGVVALLGPPNAGKSTLLNRWLGEKLSIVTARAQTTRSRILGICTRPDAQVLLVDTPGWIEGRGGALDGALRGAAEEAARDCDVAVLLVDLTRGPHPAHEALRASVGKATVLEVGTKLDLRPEATAPARRISAATDQGCDALLEEVVGLLPAGPPLYPEDDLTDRPLRFLAAEIVRGAAFEALGQEVPYGVAVEVEEYDESRPDLVRIRASLLVERASHKRIVVGAGGAMIREIGIRARRALEPQLGRQVHLELWVKVEPGWSRRPNRLKSLGYV
jgi:GTP-binding protein Era